MALPYIPTTWLSGDIVSSARLNKLEGGVKENSDAILENTADVNQLKSQISDINDELIESSVNLLDGKTLVQKTIQLDDGSQVDSNARISLKDKLYCGDGTVTIKLNGQKVWWYEYNAETEVKTAAATEWQTADFELSVSKDRLYNFAIGKIDDSAIVPSENKVAVIKYIGVKTTVQNNILLNKFAMKSGALQTASMIVASAINWLSYLVKIPISGGDTVVITLPSISGVVWHYRYGWYYASDGSLKNQNGNTTSNTLTVPDDCGYFSFAFFACDSSGNQLTSYNLMENFPADEVIKVTFPNVKTSAFAVEESIIDFVNKGFAFKNLNSVVGYSVGADMVKRSVSSKRLGTLTQNQSFCKYDNNYYSTDGDYLSVQSADFTAVSTTALSLGHGNVLQLGSSNIAYASGWNDHTVYAVNLDTVTISDTISLPFDSGIEDAVIDDVNKIAYIIHYDGTDSTDAFYDFVAYDYDNERVILQKKTPLSLSYMQAADFYGGKIFLLFGGNDASGVPARVYVFNTVGDIIAEMSIPIFTGDEPEGICFDRDTKTLLVSSFAKNLYEITSYNV